MVKADADHLNISSENFILPRGYNNIRLKKMQQMTTGNLSSQISPDQEKEIFSALQKELPYQFQHIFPDRIAPKIIVVVPSLTLDSEILSKIRGHIFYEERMLCLLMLLRMPQTRVVFVTSIPVDQITIDYYLHHLPGIPSQHAAQRLTMLSCYDASSKALTKKILERPRLINRIKQKITDARHSHLVCFNVSELERTLAVQLGIPIFGCDPELLPLGSKTGSRNLFRACNVNMPKGFEDLYTEDEVADALYKLKAENADIRKAVVKINEGFSGEGNAIFNYSDVEDGGDLRADIKTALQKIHVIADKISPQHFFEKFKALGGIVEEFIDADIKTSPSVQCRINPLGEVEIVSTHDQILGGEYNQVYLGAGFPASAEYSKEIAVLGKSIADGLAAKNVLGRFSIDFLSVYKDSKWEHYAIEINLRKGGTTHPFLMLQFLTDGEYDAASGNYVMPNGEPRFYFASDNVSSPSYIGLTPTDLIEIALLNGLMYDSTTQEGVMFHIMGALSQYGKLGMVCIAKNIESAKQLYEKTISILNSECGKIV